MRFYIELAIVAALAVFAYDKVAPRWNGFFSPLKPVERILPPAVGETSEKKTNALVPLSEPQAAAPRPAAPSSSMLLNAEKVGREMLPSNSAAPAVFNRPAIPEDSPALVRPALHYNAQVQPAWFIRLKALNLQWVAAAVFALVAGLYLGVSKGLTKR